MEWHGTPLTNFKDIGQNPDATICYRCLQKLTKCDNFEKELHKLTQEFLQYLSELSVIRTTVRSQERSKRNVPKSACKRASKLQRIEQELPVQREQGSQLGDSSDTESLLDHESDQDNSNIASPDVLVCS